MIPIFDNGHGGVIDGVYQTNGKRSPDWAQGQFTTGDFCLHLCGLNSNARKILIQTYLQKVIKD
jgi:hypothetical protein